MELNHGQLKEEARTSTRSCRSHGEYVSTETKRRHGWAGFPPIVGWSSCPTCSEELARKEAERKEAAERADLWKRTIESGIPDMFVREKKRLNNYTVENTGQKKALRVATDYANNFKVDAHETGRNLIFIGATGCGKTHLACGIGFEVLDMGGIVRYTTMGDMIRRITDTWRNRDGESESDVLRDLTSAALLILDEAGVQSGSELEIRNITNVIDGRYREQLPTILVSNLTIKDLSPLLGDRVIDRLRDHGSPLVAFNWASYRGRREVVQ